FCGVCLPEARDNQNFHAKGSYFASTGRGSHSLVFGYDNFNDIRQADNHQSGSDYRILGTTSIIRGSGDAQVISPQFLGNGSTIIQWNPLPTSSLGSSFRTHGVFANDAWRINDRLTANVGLRYDRNHGLDQAHTLVTTDSAISPRFGIIWDP